LNTISFLFLRYHGSFGGLALSLEMSSGGYLDVAQNPNDLLVDGGIVTTTFALSTPTTASELLGATVTQTGTSAAGTLGVKLDGSSVSSIVVRSDIGSAAFDALNPLSINGGTTIIAAGHLASSSDVTTPLATGTKLAVTTPDTVVPRVTEVRLYLNGVLVGMSAILQVFLSETVRIEEGFSVDYTKIRISNVTNTPNCDRAGSLCVPLAGDWDGSVYEDPPMAFATTDESRDGRGGMYFNVTLSENQRVIALGISGAGGGDGHPTMLDVDPGAFFDRAGNTNAKQYAIPITEFGDDIPPQIIAVDLRLADGMVRIELSETLDFTPMSYLDTSRMYLTNTDNATDFLTNNQIPLTGAIVHNYTSWDKGVFSFSNGLQGGPNNGEIYTPDDSLFLYLEISEEQRVRAIELSGTSGGDGVALTMDVQDRAFRDIAQNLNLIQNGITIVEVNDDVHPQLVSSTINMGTGVVTLLADETLDLTPAKGFVTSTFALSVATTASEVLGATVTQTGTSAAGTLGVKLDGSSVSALVVRSDIGSAAFDALNPLSINGGTTIIAAGHLTSSSDVTTTSRVDLSLLQIRQDAILAGDYVLWLAGHESGDSLVTSTSDGYVVSINLTENQRARSVLMSDTPGGDGNAPVLIKSIIGSITDIAQNKNEIDVTTVATEVGDVVRPSLITSTLNLNDGTLTINADETLDLFHVYTLNLSPTRPITELRGATATQLNRYVYWDLILSPALTLTQAKGSVVTQSGGSVTGVLDIGLKSVWTLTINAQPMTEYAGVVVSQAGSGPATGVLRTSVQNYWTTTCTGQSIYETAGASVTQGASTGTLRKTLRNALVTTIEIQALSGVTFDDTTDILIGTTIVAGSSLAGGSTVNTGATTSLFVIADSGSTFVTGGGGGVLTVGTTTVAGTEVTAVSESGATTTIRVRADSGVVFSSSLSLVLGTTMIGQAGIDSESKTQGTAEGFVHVAMDGLSAVSSVSIRAQWGVTFHTYTNLVLGANYGAGGITTISALDLASSALQDSVDVSKLRIRNDTELDADAVSLAGVGYDSASLAASLIPTLTLVDSDPHLGLGLALTLTEEMRVRAIQASGTTGGDFYAATLDADAGALKDLAGNDNLPIGGPTSSLADRLGIVETADTTPPIPSHGTLDLDLRILTIQISETLFVSPGSNVRVDTSKMYFSNTPGAKDQLIGNSGTVVQESTHPTLQPRPPDQHPNAPFLNITFTDPLKLLITAFSGLAGGDGTAVFLDLEAGAFSDIAGNENVDTFGILLSESPDITAPILVGCNLFLGTGIITIFFDETVDLTPHSELNISALYVSNNPQDEYMNLGTFGGLGSVVANGVVFDQTVGDLCKDGPSVNISISEEFRVLLVQRSGQPGGDGVGLTLDSYPSAAHDVGLLSSLYQPGVQILEYPDLIAPVLNFARIDLSTGILTMTSLEILDLTPHADKMNATALVFVETTDAGDEVPERYIWILTIISQTTFPKAAGQVVAQTTGTAATGTLRTALTGDGNQIDTIVIDSDVGQIFDNVRALVLGAPLPDIPSSQIVYASRLVWTLTITSTTMSEIQTATVTQGTSTGNLRLAVDGATTVLEIHVADPSIVFGPSTEHDLVVGGTTISKTDVLSSSSNKYVPRTRLDSVQASTSANAIDSLTFQFQLGEKDRVSVIESSARAGSHARSDLHRLWTLTISSTTLIHDRGITTVVQGNAVGTLYDTLGSIWTVTLTTGRTMDQFQGVTVSQAEGASSTITGRTRVLLRNAAITTFEIYATSPTQEDFDAVTDLVVGTDTIPFAILQSVVRSDTTSILVSQPLAIDGTLTTAFDHTDSVNNLVIQTVSTSTTSTVAPGSLTGSSSVSHPGPSFVLSDVGVVLDMAQAPNVFTRLVLVEDPDVIEPTLETAVLHFSTGVLDLSFSETIDTNPLTLVSLSGVYLANAADGTDVRLSSFSGGYLGGEGPATFPLGTRQDTSVRILLSEAQRVAALLLSNTPGGDSTNLLLHVDDAVSFRDVAGNPLRPEFLSDFSIDERDDVTRPSIDAGAVFLNLSDGNVRLTVSETLICTNTNEVGVGGGVFNLTKLSFSQASGDYGIGGVGENDPSKIIPLSDSRTTLSPTGLLFPTIQFFLSEADRISAIERSADVAKGGDGVALVLDAIGGAFTDVGLNPSLPISGVTVTEVVDTVPPTMTSASIDLSTGVVTLVSNEYFHKTLDVPHKDLAKIYLTDDAASGSDGLPYTTSAPQVVSTLLFKDGGASLTSVFQFTLTMTLDENQRSAAIAASAQPGGNGGAAMLVVQPGFSSDVANNFNTEHFALSLTEIPDTVDPSATKASLDFSTGVLSITFSENIDLSPLSTNVALNNIRLSQVPNATYTQRVWTITLNSAKTFVPTADAGTAVSQTNGQGTMTGVLTVPLAGDKSSIQITADAEQIFDTSANIVLAGGGGYTIFASNLNVVSIPVSSAKPDLVNHVIQMDAITDNNWEDGVVIQHTIDGRCATTSGGADRTADSDCGAANNEACNQQAACDASVASPATWTNGRAVENDGLNFTIQLSETMRVKALRIR